MSKTIENDLLGFTPEIKKFRKKSTPESMIKFISALDSPQFGFTKAFFYRYLFRKSKNVCLYPKSLNILLQTEGYEYTDNYRYNATYEKDGSYKNPGIFNKAVTRQQYIDVINQQSKDTSISIRSHNRKLIVDTTKRNVFSGINKRFNKQFKKVCTKNLIVFPIGLEFFDVSSKLKYNKRNSGHAVFVIIDRKLNKGYLIDPTNIGSSYINSQYPYDYYNVILYKANALIYRILGETINLKLVDMVCPQSIEGRGTCAGWTMFLSSIIVNQYEKSNSIKLKPSTIITNFLEKYDTKEKLQSVLNQFYYRLKEIIENPSKKEYSVNYYISGKR
jgi:hypothetical protein